MKNFGFCEREEKKVKMAVTLHTNMGDLKVELNCEACPLACENFLALCARYTNSFFKAVAKLIAICFRSGYYDGTKFHRNIKGFIVQGGDPTGTGYGGESIWKKKVSKEQFISLLHVLMYFHFPQFPDEIHEYLKHNKRGILAMANSGPNTNTSQFYFTYAKCSHLNGLNTVFGR